MRQLHWMIVCAVVMGLCVQKSVAQTQYLMPMSAEHLVRYAQVLGLDEAQRATLHTMFEEIYLPRFEQEAKTQRRRYRDTLYAADDEQRRRLDDRPPIGEAGPDADFVIEMRVQFEGIESLHDVYAIVAERFRVAISAIERTDDAFFREVEVWLTAEQRQRMPIVRGLRFRAILHPMRTLYPEARVDLTWLVIELMEHGDAVGLELDRTLLLDWLAAHEDRYIPARRQMLDGQVRTSMLMGYVTDAVVVQNRHPGLPPEELRELMPVAPFNPYTESARLLSSANGRLERLNRQGLDSLMTILPEDAMRWMTHAYHREAYPEVYPDPADAGPLFAAALAIESLDASQRQSIEALEARYRRQHDVMTQRLAEAVRWRIVGPREATTQEERNRRQLHEGWSRQEQFGLEREQLNARQRDELRRVLDESQWQHLPEWDFEENPRFRPWTSRGSSEVHNRQRHTEQRR